MWTALASILALFVVAALNIAVAKFIAAAAEPAVAQVMTTAIWALQVPLATLIAQSRGAGEKEDKRLAVASGGEPVLLVIIRHAILVFVLIQLVSALFGLATLFKDWMLSSLCAGGHQDRCDQIPKDALGAGVSAVLIGGGAMSLAAGLMACGVLGHAARWRARSLGLAAAIGAPFLAALLLWLENVASLSLAGPVDATIDRAGLVGLIVPRLGFGAAGALAGLVGFLLAWRVNAAARRYASLLRHASRRGPLPPAALKDEFLAMLGFSAATHELLVRKRSGQT